MAVGGVRVVWGEGGGNGNGRWFVVVEGEITGASKLCTTVRRNGGDGGGGEGEHEEEQK